MRGRTEKAVSNIADTLGGLIKHIEILSKSIIRLDHIVESQQKEIIDLKKRLLVGKD